LTEITLEELEAYHKDYNNPQPITLEDTILETPNLFTKDELYEYEQWLNGQTFRNFYEPS